MKTTVLKASKELAEKIAGELLQIESKQRPGAKLFRRTETENGFKIEGGKKAEPVLVFQWTDQGVGRRRIDYDERVVTIG